MKTIEKTFTNYLLAKKENDFRNQGMALLSTMRNRCFQLLTTSVLIIQLVNFSIDPADHSPNESVTINEIESFMELWIEVILGNGDVLEETEEGDENKGKRDNPSNFFFTSALAELPNTFYQARVQHNTFSRSDFKSPETTITTPPPRSLGR